MNSAVRKGFAALVIAGGVTAGTFGTMTAASASDEPAPQVVFNAPVDSHVTVQGLQATGPGGEAFSQVRYVKDGQILVTKDIRSIEHIEAGGCDDQSGVTVKGCIVTGGVGAHSEAAVALKVDTVSNTIDVSNTVQDSASDSAIRDLDGDGTPDVALKESTYDPDYATGPQFWVTYVSSHYQLVRTGCGVPATGDQAPPETLLEGNC